jgi:hypothetical protein
MKSPFLGLILVVLTASSSVHAWLKCQGGSLCPDDNTCCPTTIQDVSSCIPTKNEATGVCCNDTSAGTSACGEGFECSLDEVTQSLFCRKVDLDIQDAPDRLPRYRPCSVPAVALTQVHGFPVLFYNDTAPQLAYLSTMGALDSNSSHVLAHQARVETLFVMVHGSGRNVEDYLCSANADLPASQQDPATSNTMIIAPWFMAPKDPTVKLYHRSARIQPLRWAEFGTIFHTWRYGADAINQELDDLDISMSSYEVLDRLLEQVHDNVQRFPNLRRIVVAGHSAGGQYTQRWALLSNSRVFGKNVNDTPDSHIKVRVIVANPRSLCFLDERRMFNGTFRPPDHTTQSSCDWYNQWEWGLGPGDALDVPYKTQAIEAAGGVEELVRRYPSRDIVYLAGEHDTLLNGDCQDKLQGPYRTARSEHFFESLNLMFGRPVHHRLVVSGVHHDHSLMFQSPEGQQAISGSFGVSDETTLEKVG